MAEINVNVGGNTVQVNVEVKPASLPGPKGDPFEYEDFTPEQLEGLRGPQGIQGEKGDTGERGPQGVQGIQGERGPQGEQGIQGERGAAFTYDDFTDSQLEALRGPKGETGMTGPKGAKGDKGDKGDTGARGPQGVQGNTGPQGVQGNTGPQGDDGKSAYQVALDNGFEGTEAEWLESLKGISDEILVVYMSNTSSHNCTVAEIRDAVNAGKVVILRDHNGMIFNYAGEYEREGVLCPRFENYYHGYIGLARTYIDIYADYKCEYITNAQVKTPSQWPLTFTGAATGTYNGSAAVTVNIPEGGAGDGGGINLDSAKVGQTVVVKAVDENGKPTEWEAQNIPKTLPNPYSLLIFDGSTGNELTRYDGTATRFFSLPNEAQVAKNAAYEALQLARSGLLSYEVLADKPVGQVGKDGELIPETVLEMEEEMTVFDTIYNFEAGAVYVVTWNGMDYECTAQKFKMDFGDNSLSGVFVGNGLMVGMDTNADLPFTIGTILMGDETFTACFDVNWSAATQVTVRVVGRSSVKQLDTAYIPDTVIKTSEQLITPEQQTQARTNIGAASAEETKRLSEEIGDIVVGTNSDGGSKSRNLLYMSDTEHHTINGLEFWFEGNKIHLNGCATTGDSESDDVRLKLTGTPEYICDWVNPDKWATETLTTVERGKTYYAYSELLSGSATADPEGGSGAVLSVRDSTGTSKISTLKSPYTYAEGDARLAYAVFFIPCGATYTDAVYVFALTEGAEKVPYDELGEETQTGRKLKEDIEVPAASVIDVDESGELSELLFCKVPSKYSVTKIKDDVFDTRAAVQGMCSDGEHLYYSVVKNGDSANTLLRKYRISDGAIVATVENRSYGHANGLAYLPGSNELLICHMDDVGTVSRVNANTLAFVGSFALNDTLSAVVPWWIGVGAVAYDATRDKIIYLLRGVAEEDGRTRKGFAVFDGQMRFEKIIKTEYIESDTYSGLATDDQYIYLSVSNPQTTAQGERLVTYDWHGNVVNNVKMSGMTHFEAQAWVAGALYTVSAEIKDSANYNCASISKYMPTAYEKVSKLDLLMRYNLN